MVAVATRLLKLSQVARDGVQCKEALGDQFSVSFSCYVDIVDVKNWNMFAISD